MTFGKRSRLRAQSFSASSALRVAAISVEPEPLMDVPAIFEDFIHTLEGAGLGLLDMEESFEDARLALLARDAADLLSFGKRK